VSGAAQQGVEADDAKHNEASQLNSRLGRQWRERAADSLAWLEVVDDKTSGRALLTQVIRWTARAWSVASVGLILAFLVGEGFHPSQIKAREWLGLVFFPLGITVGMILAWWREGLGGAITVASLVVFYLIPVATAGALPKGWAFLVFAMPGFLFLLCWTTARRARISHA
jgi:hypothetical protein